MQIITGSPKITIVLLNFQRPQNIPVILEAIARQTVKATVFLWNNGDADVDSPKIDRYHQSESNIGCMVRWKLAREATTPYVMSLDDDICFHRVDALEHVIQCLEKQDNPNRIVGFLGACFNLVPNYAIRREFMCTYRDTNGNPCLSVNTHRIGFLGKDMFVIRRIVAQDEGVDVVKGRVMAFRKQLLEGISLPEEREDDIFLSATLANKARKFHRIPTLLNDAFYELPEHGEGSWHEPGHFLSRDRALKTYFGPNAIYDNWLSENSVWAAYLFKNLAIKLFHRRR